MPKSLDVGHIQPASDLNQQSEWLRKKKKKKNPIQKAYNSKHD